MKLMEAAVAFEALETMKDSLVAECFKIWEENVNFKVTINIQEHNHPQRAYCKVWKENGINHDKGWRSRNQDGQR